MNFTKVELQHFRLVIFCREVALSILNSDDWLLALKTDYTSASGDRLTPLRLLIGRFPMLARCFSKTLSTPRKLLA
jgi:hypothetical protein